MHKQYCYESGEIVKNIVIKERSSIKGLVVFNQKGMAWVILIPWNPSHKTET